MSKFTDLFPFGISSIINSLSKEAIKLQKLIDRKSNIVKSIDIEVEMLLDEKQGYQNEITMAKNILKDLLKYNKNNDMKAITDTLFFGKWATSGEKVKE